MLTHEIEIRVRYAEVDRMGFLFHGHYLSYFDSARNEFLRSLGRSNFEMEESGVMFPVLHADISYLNPAHFDDILTIKTTLKELPKVKFTFYHEVYNQHGELITKAEITLVSMSRETKKAIRPPLQFLEILAKHM